MKDDTIQGHVHAYTDYRPSGKTISNAVIDINNEPSLYNDLIRSQVDVVEQFQS